MVEIHWINPLDLPNSYTKTRVYRSAAEQVGHVMIAEFDTTDPSGNTVLSFTDPMGDDTLFYMLKYFDPTASREYDDFSLGFFPFTPREKRILSFVAGWVPDMIKPDLTDFDMGYAMRLALNDFNVYPPETNFSISSFPSGYEQFLVEGTKMHIVLQKYLKIAIRDFSYADAGLSLNLDRGAKLQQSREGMVAAWQAVIAQAKFNFINQGVGLGTVPLPLSLGGNLNRGMMNALDLMNMMGR